MSKTIREIESVIGQENLPLLLTRYSGQRVFIPRPNNLHSNHDLVTYLGREAAEKFCSHFGGNALYVPMNRAAKITSRNQAIVKDYSTGMKVADLARKYDISGRSVERALNCK